jgi:hypothetical protein
LVRRHVDQYLYERGTITPPTILLAILISILRTEKFQLNI